MEANEVEKDELAEVKLAIAQQQEKLAQLGRSGRRMQARQFRDRLLRLIYRKDLLEEE